MESEPTSTPAPGPAPSGAAPGVPRQVSPGDVGMGAGSGSATPEEQRRKWREKGRLARARKKASANGVSPVAGSGETLAASAPAASAVGAGDGAAVAPAPVAWNPTRLRDLWAQIIPTIEAEDIADLREKAEAVDPCLVQLVETEAPWNKLSKATLIETGPTVTADFLNAAGIGAEKADLVAFGLAAFAIYRGRCKVARKLEKMLKDKLEREERAKTLQAQAQARQGRGAEDDREAA